MERQPKYPAEITREDFVWSDTDAAVEQTVTTSRAEGDSYIAISRPEYDSYVEMAARVEVVKSYIEKESYPSTDVIRIMLGIDKHHDV